MPIHRLPCGCQTCGCACPEHSISGRMEPCPAHGVVVVARFIAGEIATLAVLALFFGVISIWAAILGG